MSPLCFANSIIVAGSASGESPKRVFAMRMCGNVDLPGQNMGHCWGGNWSREPQASTFVYSGLCAGSRLKQASVRAATSAFCDFYITYSIFSSAETLYISVFFFFFLFFFPSFLFIRRLHHFLSYHSIFPMISSSES